MAITLDQTLGSNSALSATVAITTGATAAAGSRIVVIVSWFASTGGAPSGVSDGSAYTRDLRLTNGSDFIDVWSRVLVGSLASGSTITVTMVAGGLGEVMAAACSYLGTTAVDTTANNTGTTAAAWATGSATNAVADALYVCGAGTDGSMTSESSTPGTGNERFDFFVGAANQSALMQDLIVSSIAARTLTGTWSTTLNLTTQTMGLVIYKGTAGAAAPSIPPQRAPLSL